jgi:hypothetical protein
MEINSGNVKIVEKTNKEVQFHEEITDLEVKIELSTQTGNIKTEVFEEGKKSESFRIIGEKWKNEERLILENKKIKYEFVVLEESDYKQEPQEIEEPSINDLNNQVTNIFVSQAGGNIAESAEIAEFNFS